MKKDSQTSDVLCYSTLSFPQSVLVLFCRYSFKHFSNPLFQRMKEPPNIAAARLLSFNNFSVPRRIIN
jgi:hypothetical protein